MVGGRGNVSLPFCVDWHHFGAISGTCVPVHQNHGHTMLSDGNIFFSANQISLSCAPSSIDSTKSFGETKETNANS